MCRRCEREKMAPHAGAASADRDLQPKAFLSSPPSALTSKARRFITGTATMAWVLMAAYSLQSQFHFGYASGQVATTSSAARRAEGRYLPSTETAHLVEHDLLHRNLQAPEEEDHDDEEGHHHDDEEEDDADHAADAAAASGAKQNPDIEGDEHEHDEEDEGHHEDAVAGTEEEGHEAHKDDHHENDGEVHDDHDDEHEHDEDEATGTAAAAELAEGGADDGHGHTEEDADHDHDHVEMEAEAEGHHEEEEDEEEGDHDHHDGEEEGEHDHHDDEEEGDHDLHDDEEEGDHDHHHDEEEGDHDHHDDEEEGEHDHHDDEEGEHDHHDDEDGEEHEHDHSEAEAMAASLNADNSSKPWGEVILATLLVNVTALIGVIFLIPAIARSKLCCTALTKRMGTGDRAPPQSAPARSAAAAAGDAERRGHVIDIAVPSFGAGALLATSVFLVLPEAIHLLAKGAASVIDASGEHGDHDGHGHRVRHLQDDGHGDDEAAIAWKFGTAILGGYLMPIVLGAFFPRALEHKCDDECGEAPDLRESPAAAALLGSETELRVPEAIATDHCCRCEVEAADAVPKSIDVEGGAAVIASTSVSVNDIETAPSGGDNCPSCHSHSSEKKAGECCTDLDHSHHSDGCFGDKDFVDGFADEKAAAECKHSGKTKTFRRRTRPNINYELCASILLGDGIHNFADGIFIGIAFLLCSRDVAIAIVAATLYHEMAQELADFFLLTKHAGLSVLWALTLNFCSGLFVVLGGVTILSVDGLTAQAVGIILSVAAGVYIHIAASECIPRVDANLHDWKDRLLGILMFVCGAVPIGLVLLAHFHCEG